MAKPITSTQSQQEAAVGITAYIAPDAPGLSCVIKQRYTDFLVNEIQTNGEVVHLRTVSLPTPTQDKRNGSTVEDTAATAKSPKTDPPVQAGLSLKRPRDESTREDTVTEAPDLTTQSNAVSQPQVNGESVPPAKKQRIDEASEGDVDTVMSQRAGEAAKEEASTQRERKTELTASFPKDDKASLSVVFGDAIAAQIVDLHADTILHPQRKPREHPTVLSEPISEKSKRTEAHVAVRKIFSGRLETATLQDRPGIISIKAASTKAAQGARGQTQVDGAMQKGKLGWHDLGGEYLHFTLYKENKDTMEALHYIATQLKVRANMFQFAGTKDRRGVTVQRVAIFRVRAEQVVKLNKLARGWRVGDFSYEKHGLELGESAGNEFLLTLRDCQFQGSDGLDAIARLELAQEAASTAGDLFRRRGFLNYYGLQRFGTYATGTHIIGKKMLQGDLKGAIDCILHYDSQLLPEKQDPTSSDRVPQDDIARADAIRKWRDTGRYNDHDKTMPRRFQAESSIMQYLSRRDRSTGKFMQDQDWQGALTTIQRNLRMMYVHAYQSFVWNTMASRRWETHGERVVAGDLVIVGEKDGEAHDVAAQVDEDGEPVFNPAEHDTAQGAGDDFTRARPLSQPEAESGKYDIFDIVLPLPGYDVKYPSNEVGKHYEEFMGSEAGGGLDPHSMQRSWKDLSLSGAYRKLVAKPGPAFSMEVKQYQDDDKQMVQTDLEVMQRQDGQPTQNGMPTTAGAPSEGQTGQAGSTKLAVILKMQLGSSQYATMALRELTKGGAGNYKPDFSAR